MNMFKRYMPGIGIVVMLIAAGCGGGGGNERTISTGDGDSVTTSTDLPDDFPDSFPIYDGADLQGAIQGEQDGIVGIVATWTTGDDASDVADFYENAFGGDEWTVVLSGSAGGSQYWSVEQSNGDQVGYVAVSGGDETTIMATVGDDPNATSSDGDSSSDDEASSDGDDGDSDEASSDDDGSSDDEVSSDDDGSGSDVEANLPDAVELPDGFPSDIVSIPDDARVTTSQSYSANGQETFIVGFFTKDEAKDVGEHYKNELEGNGFTQSFQTSDANGVYAAYAENDDGTGTIIAISVNDNNSYEGYREAVVQVTVG
jgi:hypothetical protein